VKALAALACLTVLGLGACATQTQSVELSGDTFVARKRLARELVRRGEWSSAFSYADQLHRERPRDPEALVLRGTIYRERGMWVESEADLVGAVKLDNESPDAHAALGILYDLSLRPVLAEPQHRAAVRLAPDNASYLNNLGFSLFLRGKYRDSIEQYERAASLDPTSRRVRTNLGFAFAATGDLRRASHEFEMGGTAAEAKNNLGFAYERRGDLPRAYDLYAEATVLDPKSTHARTNLVHAAQVLGRPVPAAAVPAPAPVVPPTEPAAPRVFGPPSPDATPPASPTPSPNATLSPPAPSPLPKDLRP
jgi:Flp pilus assembly protein TadD